jgi:hypothetical protein
MHAQQDEAPGAKSQITASIPTGGFSCGRASYPLYCYGIPASVGGSFWLDAYTSTQQGFIAFNQVADLGQATITSSSTSTNNIGLVTQLMVTFRGSTNDGDGGTYIGTGTFTFSYYKTSRGFYVQVLQSGTVNITYN